MGRRDRDGRLQTRGATTRRDGDRGRGLGERTGPGLEARPDLRQGTSQREGGLRSVEPRDRGLDVPTAELAVTLSSDDPAGTACWYVELVRTSDASPSAALQASGAGSART